MICGTSVRTDWICGATVLVIAGIACAQAAPQATEPSQPPQRGMIVRDGGPVKMTMPGMGPGATKLDGKARMQKYAAALGLDPDQTTAAMGLYDAYAATTRASAEKMRDSMQHAQELIREGDMKGFQEKTQQAMTAQRDATEAAEKSFLDDLRTLLTPAQEGNWPKFERLRRREQLMSSFGGVGGSGVDLFKVVDGLDMPEGERAKLAEQLGIYELDLDRLLLDRKRLIDDMQKDAWGGGGKGAGPMGHDLEKMTKINEKQRAVDIDVRDLNDKTTRVMADLLEDPWKGKLLERVQQQSFRSIYRETAVAQKLKSAQKLGSLTAQQKEQLKAIEARYRADAKPANDAWAAAKKKAETAGRASNFPVMMLGGGDGLHAQGPQEDPDLAAARNARRDLDKSAREQMEKVLTPEQLAELPDTSGPGNGLFGQAIRVEAIGDGNGDMMVVASDEIPIDHEDLEGAEGGVVIFRTVEVTAPGTGPAPAPAEPATPASEPKK